MADPQSTIIRCQCGAQLRIPPGAAGKRVRCPKCEYRIAIPADGKPLSVETSARPGAAPVSRPAPQRPTTPPAGAAGPARPAALRPPPPVAHDESDSLLDDFMQLETAAETSAGPDLAAKQKTCPSCKAAMTKDATICVMCGHDTSKREVAPAAAKGRKAKAAAAGAARSGGRFLVGCGLSCLGALIGAGIWFGLALATEREFGLIAILVGALAGGGMAYGNKAGSALAGWTAAFISVGGIFLAKVLIFGFVLYGLVTGDTSNIDIQREYVVLQTVEERLNEEGVWSDEQREEKWDQYHAESEAQVAAMSDAEVRTRWQELKNKEADFDTSLKHSRLADHRAERRAQDIGAPPGGEEYGSFFNQEMAGVRALSPQDLDAAIAELDAWEAGAKWNDPGYVRNYLIYDRAEKACDAELESVAFDEEVDYDALYASAWKKHHKAAAAEVDNLSSEQQVQQAKDLDAEYDRQSAEFEAKLAELKDNVSGKDIALAGGALFVIFIIGMFGLFGTIFTIIAAVTAYRVAANGMAT